MKTFLVIALFLMTAFLFAENAISVIDLNGNNWTAWSEAQKKTWIAGFISSHYAITSAMDDLGLSKEKPDWYNWLILGDTMENIIGAMDYFYNADQEHLSYPIWNVILIVFNRNWWDQKPQMQTMPEATPIPGVQIVF